MADTRNPYAPPKARVADPIEPHTAPFEGTFIPNGRSVAAGRGAGWIGDAWRLFRARPGKWLLTMLILLVFYVVIGQIPFEEVLGALIWPFIVSGIVIAADLQRRTGTFTVSAVFAGLRKPTPLLVLGALALLTLVALYASFAIVAGREVATQMVFNAGKQGATQPPARDMVWAMLLYFMLALPVTAATYFAPPLIMLHGLSAGRAIKMSLLGSIKNIVPGIVFLFCAIGFVLVSAIPLGLGLIVSIPVLILTTYTVYRDVFVEPSDTIV